MKKQIAILALVIFALPATAKEHQDTLSGEDSAPGLESFGYADEKLPTYEKAPQKRLLTGETVSYDVNKTKVVSDKQKKKSKKAKTGKKNTKIALGSKGPVEWVDLLEKDRIRKQEDALAAALAADEEKKANLEALGVKEEPKDKTGKGDGSDEGDKKNAATNGPMQKKDGDLAGLSTSSGPGSQASGGEAPAPKGAALKYTNINRLDNGTEARFTGDSIVVNGRSVEAVETPITGATLQAFQQAKYKQEGNPVTLQQAFGIRDPAAANIVAYTLSQPQGLTSFFGITPDRFSYYYPTNRQIQLEMNSGQDAQVQVVFFERRGDGRLMPIAGGSGEAKQGPPGGGPPL